jgi:hypothetical protein
MLTAGAHTMKRPQRHHNAPRVHRRGGLLAYGAVGPNEATLPHRCAYGPVTTPCLTQQSRSSTPRPAAVEHSVAGLGISRDTG